MAFSKLVSGTRQIIGRAYSVHCFHAAKVNATKGTGALIRGYITASEVNFRVLEARDEPEVKALLYANYYAGEPISRALGLESPRESRCVEEAIMPYVVSDQMSIVAVDRGTEEIVAFGLGLITSPGNSKIPILAPDDPDTEKMRIAADIAKQVAGGFDIYDTFNVQCALALGKAVTKPACKSIGLLTRMTQMSENRAREKGIRVMYTTTTSLYTRKIVERLGFTKINEIQYSEFLNNGKPLFGEMGVHTSCCFFVKYLDI